MEKRITLRLLFVIALLVLSSVDVEAKARKITSEVNRKLKLLNKPAIKSIKVIFFSTKLSNILLCKEAKTPKVNRCLGLIIKAVFGSCKIFFGK